MNAKKSMGKHARVPSVYPEKEKEQIVPKDDRAKPAAAVPPLPDVVPSKVEPPAPPAPEAAQQTASPAPEAAKPPRVNLPSIYLADKGTSEGDGDAGGSEQAEAATDAAADAAPAVAPDASDDGEARLFSAIEAGLADGTINSQNYPTGFLSIVPEGVTLKKKRSVGKAVAITLGVIIGVLLVAYLIGVAVFSNLMFPRTTLIDKDVSMMSNGDVVQLMDKTVDGYTLDVVGTGYSQRFTASDVGLTVDSQGVVDGIHQELNAWAWPAVLIEGAHDVTDCVEPAFESQKYDYKVVSELAAFNKEAIAPVDATIVYDEETKTYKVKEEQIGTQYDSHIVLAAMAEAIEQLQPKVKLTGDFLIQPNVFATDERIIEAAQMATGMVSANVMLSMAGIPVAQINGDALQSFIHMDAALGVTLDEAALTQWVTDLTNGFDTVGTQRSYTRADGKQITVSGGVYGWLTDAAATRDQVVNAIKGGETTTIEMPCQQTAGAYNGPGQRDWGTRYVDVDISEQYVRFYGDDGSIIWESACISGQPDGKHNTVNGVWRVNNKESPSKLIGYEDGKKQYETTVQYWMAFEANSIGFHDATWQPSFGGSMYAEGYGSHGCVNLSYGAAESLYSIINVGDVVVVHF